MKMQVHNAKKYVLLLLLALLAGCSSPSSSSTASSSESTSSKLKDTGKSAWGAASFVMNIANPTYYAKKAGKYAYNEYQEHKDN